MPPRLHGKTPPWPRKFKGWDHNAYCRGKCLAIYMECIAENAATETFDTAAEAAYWLARHPEKEYKSIELAANSMLFIVTNMQIKQFDQYLQDLTREEPVGQYRHEAR